MLQIRAKQYQLIPSFALDAWRDFTRFVRADHKPCVGGVSVTEFTHFSIHLTQKDRIDCVCKTEIASRFTGVNVIRKIQIVPPQRSGWHIFAPLVRALPEE